MIESNGIYIDKVLYTDKENVNDKDVKNVNYITREIKSVYDYLRAIMSVLSNYFITDYYEYKIQKFENLFSLNDSALKDKLNEGVFFRGQGKDYRQIIPGIYRNMSWFKNESELQKRIEMIAPESFSKAHNSFERLALMQHYGLRTRILDISTNALVALYFAVTNDKEDDGVVYIFKKPDDKESLTAYSDRVSIKMAISNLNYNQKLTLSMMLSDHKEEHIEIRSIAETIGNPECLSVVDAVYSFYRRDTGDYVREIYAEELYGMELVLPNRMDARLSNQEGAFFLFGLEDISTATEKAEENIIKNIELNKKKEDLSAWERLQKQEGEQDEIDEETVDRCSDEIKTLTAYIEREENKIRNKTIIESIREEINRQINKAEINYSPESVLSFNNEDNIKTTMGSARIKISHNYKSNLLNELKMLGINEGIVYPDLSHKTSAVNEWYS